MKLTVLIVNYNGKKYLGDCLESIKRNVTVDHEVIMVDNASIDDSCEYVQASFPYVRLLVSRENLGFAGGNNFGSSQARGEYLLLLNNDTVLLNDVAPAIELLECNHKVGNVGAMMLDGSEQYNVSAGYFPSPLRLFRLTSLYKKDGYFKKGNFPQQRESGYCVDWVAGSFLLTRRVLWDRIKGMDDGYFMYGEDVDYCRKTYDAGFSTIYYPQIRYVHYGGFEPSRHPLLIFGFLRYHKKYSPAFQRVLASGILFSGLLVRALLYGLLFTITRKAAFGIRTDACVAALKLF